MRLPFFGVRGCDLGDDLLGTLISNATCELEFELGELGELGVLFDVRRKGVSNDSIFDFKNPLEDLELSGYC